jgi:REP element-mobilizing transposase RayT
MSQPIFLAYLHIVFCTKGRQPLLSDEVKRIAAFTSLSNTCKALDCPGMRVGGTEDHVHVLCRLGDSISVEDLVNELKRASTRELNARNPEMQTFSWQEGYVAFSVGPEDVEEQTKYIANQERHHREESYTDELRRLLIEQDVQCDERDLWD